MYSAHVSAGLFSRVGFLESPVEEAPSILVERYGLYAESGLKVVLMKR